ncbi:signal transduction histidine kinase, LytS [Fibrella aestuarina BUZ 2]|uniref:Signal transduction histidine kinase, LytS n=2 Tax=Fibrella TaxID=861914 RepID=I0K552_9BACT|nr:signal transduction histidine kinase, LytS [Fibrella aestuarina BUZ 2]
MGVVKLDNAKLSVKIRAVKSIIPGSDWPIRIPHLPRMLAWFQRYGRTILLHLLAWFLHFTVNNLLLFIGDYHQITPQRTLFTYSLAALLFYANTYLVVQPQVARKQYIRLLLYTVVLLAVFIGLRYLLFYYYFPAVGYVNEYSSFSTMFSKFLPDSIWIALQYLLFSYGYWFALDTIRLERQKQRMQHDMLQLEQAKVQSELAFLRVQLNPHFIFNTLNFFYSEALNTSTRLADAIFELATMMRTVMQLSSKSLVTVEHELNYIRHYINLQRLRFGDQMNLELTVEGDELEAHLSILPLILISLIENIFKYGDLSDVNNPATVRIVLDDNSLSYYGNNAKKEFPTYSQGGVGMKNIEKQLTIFYDDMYDLKVQETKNFYAVEIHINFTEVDKKVAKHQVVHE